MKVNAIFCESCGDIIYSRVRHDFRNCSCGNVFVDGGTDYFRYGAENTYKMKVMTLNIKATKKQLYDDWNSSKDKLGFIKGKKYGKIKSELKRPLQKKIINFIKKIIKLFSTKGIKKIRVKP